MEKNEKMKKFAVIGIVLSLFVGIVYTGVLNYYGKIVGTINVQGPIFYADSLNIGGVYYKMKINEVGSGTVTLQDGSRVLFVTDSLNVSSWYSATWIVNIKLFSPSNGSLSAIRIKRIDKNFLEFEICKWEGIPLAEGNNSIQKRCDPGTISFNTTDRLGLEIVGAGVSDYIIYTDGSTRIEVIKAP